MAKIFISYAFIDGSLASTLTDLLEANNHEVFRFDTVLPGEVYTERFLELLKECDVFIALLSQHSIKNANVWKEIGAATSRQSKNSASRAIFLSVDGVRIPYSVHENLSIETSRDRLQEDFAKLNTAISLVVGSREADKQKRINRAAGLANAYAAIYKEMATPMFFPGAYSLANTVVDLVTNKLLGGTDSKKGEDLPKVLQDLIGDYDLHPMQIDRLMSNHLDRKLKSKFAHNVLVLAVFITLLSYAVVILNSILEWGISEIAITALVIEAPLQFIGLLYIVAKNLFPEKASSDDEQQVNSQMSLETAK